MTTQFRQKIRNRVHPDPWRAACQCGLSLTHWLVWMLPLGMRAQPVNFNSIPLDYIYNSGQYPPTITDVDGDGSDELVRFNTEGVYIDFFPISGGRYTRHIPLSIQHPPKWSVCAADVDRNGRADFVLGGDKRVTVLLQSGDSYTELVLDGSLVSQRSNLLDIDGDGDLDLFVCNDEGENFYYKNDGIGHFSRSTALSDLSALAGNYSSIWSDFNGDRLADLYLSKCFANVPPADDRRKNLLYLNKGNGQFEEQGQQSGVADTAQSWTSAVEDFDNDGDMDLYVLNHDLACRLYRNNGDGSFTDVIGNSGLNAIDYTAFEVVTGDFNNDGYCDVLTDQQQALFLGNGDLTFTYSPGSAKAGAVGDINNDGFLDVFKGRTLFENAKNENHWVKIRLNGIQSNHQGIGAICRIYTAAGTQTRELRAGQGYAAMSGLQIHFGLGKECHIDSLKIWWPSGITTTIQNLLADASYEITECEGQSYASLPKIKDSTMCSTPMILHAPDTQTDWFWSGGETGSSISVDKPGIYTAFGRNSIACWYPAIRYQIRSDNTNPPVFIRDSILTSACQGNELRLPWYEDSSILASQNWSGKKIIVADQEGRYRIEKTPVCAPGQVLTDSLDISFMSIDKATVDSTNWTQDSVTFYSSDPNTLWYQDDQSNEPLAQGPSYTGSIAFLFNKVFLEAYQTLPYPVQRGGRINADGASSTFANRDLYFSVNEDLILHSVDMFVLKKENEGLRKITLTTGDGEMIAEYVRDLKEGKNKVDLDIQLQKGKYRLRCDRNDQAMNAGDYNYPYPLANLGSIDSCSGNVNFYPYFYNWQFSSLPLLCTSERNVFIWLSTHEKQQRDEIFIYPNPASDKIYLGGDAHSVIEFTIFQLDGKFISLGGRIEDEGISVAHLLPGVYELKLKTAKSECITKLIFIAR